MRISRAPRTTTALALALALTLSACGGTGGATDGIEATAAPTDDSSGTGGDDNAAGGTDTGDTGDTADAGSATGAQGAQDGGAGDDVTAASLAAIEVAQRETGGTAYEIDGDDDGTWEVDLRVDERSVTVEVDADGAVTRVEEDDLDAEDRAAVDAAQVSLEEAITTAVDEVGGTLDDATLEEEGDPSWEVSVDLGAGDDVDVRVDAVTGEVLGTDD